MNPKRLIPLFFAVLIVPFFTRAQVTTSSITGVVKDKGGNILPGASVTATHVPTGTVYSTIARSGGRFDINNMNPGGPYTITSTFVGYDVDKKDDLFLQLGEEQRVDFLLSEKATQLQAISITGTRSAKSGNETQISREKLAILPTVGRNLNDFVRFTPQTKITSTGGISIAGQNNRYNGFLIDGAVNNDVFGVSDQGTNGGRAGTPPISIDAVDQIVVQISPYDAALGNFTGGAINAITKSGTNTFHGTAYYIFRNEDFAGKTPGKLPDSVKRVKLTPFKNQTYGVSIGGPIVKNKAFFFVNAEIQNDSRPQPYTPVNVLNPDGSIRFNVADTVAKLVNFLKAPKYGYDPGDYLNNPDEVDRVNINSRFDFNLNSNNKLTLSYRYTKAERTNPSRSTSSTINFVNSAEFFPSSTHSGNLELNSKFSDKANNKFRVSFTDVVDDRGPKGEPFPNVSILTYNGGPAIAFGTEPASSANLLKQRIINFYDALKIYKGKNSITIGADIDFNKSYNLFINRAYSLYTYAALGPNDASQINPLTSFIEDRGPSRIRRGYSLVDDNSKVGDDAVNSAANFKSVRLGFFINDDIKVTDKFTLTFGIRADKTTFTTAVPTDQFFNDTARPVIAAVYDLKGAFSGQKFNPTWQLSPRIGFKYNIDDEGVVIRGGIGIFGGRTPLVWPGGVYQNNGITIGALDASRTTGQLTAPGTQYGLQLGGQPVLFRSDVTNQYTQTDFGLSPLLIRPQGDLNIIAKNFHLPAVLRTSLGADKKIGDGWTANFDVMYTWNLYEVDWKNVNIDLPTVMTSGPDARLVHSTTGNPVRFVYRPYGTTNAIRNPYGNIILVQNTSGQKGFSYNLNIGIEKATRKGFTFNASYTYGNSQVHNEATSSINTSNWLNMEAVSSRNALPLSTSDFDMGHRIFALASKKFTYSKGHLATTITFVYNGQSGSPFSYVMNGAAFIGDGGTLNDLMYIPASRAEMDQMSFVTNGLLTPTQQKDQFEEFIESDRYLRKHRGKFAERNGARAPFTNIVDANIQQDFSIKSGAMRHTLSVRFDIFNLTNLIDESAGRQYFFNFDQAAVLNVSNFTGNTPNYRFNEPPDNKVGVISDGTSAFNSSRWNGQLTLRYSF